MSSQTIVTLLTDFGTADGFVAAMKGMILTRAPQACLVDITHEIPPQDVRAGAWALRESCWTFPAGTIHLVVIDPGVGTIRKPILLQSRGQLFLGPDNGVLTLGAATEVSGWTLDRAEFFALEVSATFHGRDIFAPVAGWLAAGTPPGLCGTPMAQWNRLALPPPRIRGHGISGIVVHVDRFGNLITNLAREQVSVSEAWTVILPQGAIGTICRTYAEVEPGQWVAYWGSSGFLELAIRDGSARAAGYSLDTEVTLCRPQ
jgi:S-adenosyl-L-methionine hydrolase (adenosine-forming)